MRIIDGKRFYAADEKNMEGITANGWDNYDGSNHQWYSLFFHPASGVVLLSANNSGDCYGDYKDRYFSSPQKFNEWAVCREKSVSKLLGEIDENNEITMKFVDAIWPNKNKENVNG